MALLYSELLPHAWEAPNFTLLGTDDKQHSLSDYTNKKGLLVIFTCNHCPYAKASWPILQKLYIEFGDRVHFVAINPNDSENYPDDSFEKMKENNHQYQITFPYLWDKDQVTAKAYKAQCTPDIYLFENRNSKPELFYHGRINDNWQEPAKVQQFNLKEAIEKLVNNQDAPKDQPPSMGCSIKWK